jgi:hypothetical protein
MRGSSDQHSMGSSLFNGFCVVLLIIMLWLLCKMSKKDQPFIDYMPSVVVPCPSHYKCGAASIDQASMENDLYSNLRESNKYMTQELLNTDECCVEAKDSEPTKSVMSRSAKAQETPLPEGMYTPENDFEQGMMSRPIR